MIKIRPAKPEDTKDILQLVRELAVFEKLEHALVATEDDYLQSLFGDRPIAECLVAQQQGSDHLVGYAIYFTTFSSFVGRAGIWLEDIYVQPDFRQQGTGKKLLRQVASIAHQRNAGRYEWCVLDWNSDAIDFYRRAGASVLKEWRIVRMEGEKISLLASIGD